MRVGSACLAHHPTSGSYRLNKGLGAGLATIAAWLAFTLGLGGVPPSLLGATSLDVIRVYRRCVSRHGSILDLHAHRCSMLVTALTSFGVGGVSLVPTCPWEHELINPAGWPMRLYPWWRAGLVDAVHGQPLGADRHLTAVACSFIALKLLDRVVGWAWCSQRHATVLGLLHLLRLCDPHNIGPKRLLSWWRYCLIGPDRVDRVHAAALSTRCHLSRMAHTLRGVVRCANLYRS